MVVDPFHAGEALVVEALEAKHCVVAIFTLDKNFCVSELSSYASLANNPDVEIIFAHEGAHEAVANRLRDELSWIPSAVIAGSEPGVILATRVAASLGLPGNDPQLISAARNKFEMRRAVAASGLASPIFRLCAEWDDVAEFCSRAGFPVVLKTPQGAGTNLVRICKTLDETMWAFDEICSTRDLFGQKADTVVAEEFIGGDEYIVNLFHDGRKVHVVDTWKYDKIDTSWARSQYRTVLLWEQNCDVAAALHDYAIRVSRAVGLRIGYAHCELKFCPKRQAPVLIEIGLRQPGGGISDHLRAQSCFDPYKSTIQVFSGDTPAIKPSAFTYQKGCATLFGSVLTAGRLVSVKGLEAVKALPSFLSVSMSVSVGQELKPSFDMTGIPWCVQLAHTSRSQLAQDISAVHEKLQLVVEADATSDRISRFLPGVSGDTAAVAEAEKLVPALRDMADILGADRVRADQARSQTHKGDSQAARTLIHSSNHGGWDGTASSLRTHRCRMVDHRSVAAAQVSWRCPRG